MVSLGDGEAANFFSKTRRVDRSAAKGDRLEEMAASHLCGGGGREALGRSGLNCWLALAFFILVSTYFCVGYGRGLRILPGEELRIFGVLDVCVGEVFEIACMRKPFDTLFASMEKDLEGLGSGLSNLDRYSRGIGLIREKIALMQVAGRKWVTNGDTEVAFFREVWPVFFGRLFLYISLYQFEVQRWTYPADLVNLLVSREERLAAAFFRTHEAFWMYYRSGSTVVNEQFTRAYSRSRILDPLSLVIDPEWATLGAYEAAQCIAMEAYKMFLLAERDRLLQPAAPEDAGDYTWGPTDTDFVEWLNSLQAVGAVLYKGKPSDLSHLQKWAAWALNKQVANIYDRFNVLRNRKRQRMAFLKRTEVALEKKMDAKK